MKLQSTVLNPPFNPSNIADNLLPYFPWTLGWAIKVSSGLSTPLGSFLVDVQEILGSDPKIRFLRIIEEPVQDEVFRRKLHVFIQSNIGDKTAKNHALQHAIKKVERHSQTICYRCGNKLIDDYKYDENLVENYCSDEGIDEYKFQFMKICTNCIEKKYSETEVKKITSSAATIEKNKDQPVFIEEPVKIEECDSYKDPSGDEIIEDTSNDNVDYINMIALYNVRDVDKLENDYKGATREHANRVKSLVKRIRETTHEKRLATIPEQWKECCDQLISDFPNFTEVILFIKNQLALSAISNQVLRLPPFLLVGDAGIGKTEFMLTLANLFNTTLSVIDIANSQSGSALSGSENFWGNTKPSQLFDTLMFGEVANPIVMLDEIDKAHTDSAYKPLAALHGLLEPRQASQFKDLSVPEIKVDASHILWIATANKLDLIENPIVDRFTVFHIDTPTPKQMLAVVKNQYQRFIENNPAGSYFEQKIRDEVAEELSVYHPRNVRKVLDLAFGLAAMKKRNFLTVSDVQTSAIKRPDEVKGIGFMSDI